MVSVERIKQFSVIPSEAEWKKKDLLPPSNWPTHGNIELKNLQVKLESYSDLQLFSPKHEFVTETCYI